MKKKHLIITVIIVIIIFAIYIIINTIPFYPDFQKKVDSYSEMKNEQPENIYVILPEDLSLNLENESYHILLDGRTILSKVKGFKIEGERTIDQTKVFYDFHNMIDENFKGDRKYRYGDHIIETKSTKSDDYQFIDYMFSIREEKFLLSAVYVNSSNSYENVDKNISSELEKLIETVINQMW